MRTVYLHGNALKADCCTDHGSLFPVILSFLPFNLLAFSHYTSQYAVLNKTNCPILHSVDSIAAVVGLHVGPRHIYICRCSSTFPWPGHRSAVDSKLLAPFAGYSLYRECPSAAVINPFCANPVGWERWFRTNAYDFKPISHWVRCRLTHLVILNLTNGQ